MSVSFGRTMQNSFPSGLARTVQDSAEVTEQAQASAAVALEYHRSAVRWNSQARSSSEKAEKMAS